MDFNNNQLNGGGFGAGGFGGNGGRGGGFGGGFGKKCFEDTSTPTQTSTSQSHVEYERLAPTDSSKQTSLGNYEDLDYWRRLKEDDDFRRRRHRSESPVQNNARSDVEFVTSSSSQSQSLSQPKKVRESPEEKAKRLAKEQKRQTAIMDIHNEQKWEAPKYVVLNGEKLSALEVCITDGIVIIINSPTIQSLSRGDKLLSINGESLLQSTLKDAKDCLKFWTKRNNKMVLCVQSQIRLNQNPIVLADKKVNTNNNDIDLLYMNKNKQSQLLPSDLVQKETSSSFLNEVLRFLPHKIHIFVNKRRSSRIPEQKDKSKQNKKSKVLEQAPNGRALCRSCDTPLLKGELRIRDENLTSRKFCCVRCEHQHRDQIDVPESLQEEFESALDELQSARNQAQEQPSSQESEDVETASDFQQIQTFASNYLLQINADPTILRQQVHPGHVRIIGGEQVYIGELDGRNVQELLSNQMISNEVVDNLLPRLAEATNRPEIRIIPTISLSLSGLGTVNTTLDAGSQLFENLQLNSEFLVPIRTGANHQNIGHFTLIHGFVDANGLITFNLIDSIPSSRVHALTIFNKIGKMILQSNSNIIGFNLHDVSNDIPVQMTSTDCGIFLLAAAQKIMTNGSLNYSQSDMNQFRRQLAYDLSQNHIRPLECKSDFEQNSVVVMNDFVDNLSQSDNEVTEVSITDFSNDSLEISEIASGPYIQRVLSKRQVDMKKNKEDKEREIEQRKQLGARGITPVNMYLPPMPPNTSYPIARPECYIVYVQFEPSKAIKYKDTESRFQAIEKVGCTSRSLNDRAATGSVSKAPYFPVEIYCSGNSKHDLSKCIASEFYLQNHPKIKPFLHRKENSHIGSKQELVDAEKQEIYNALVLLMANDKSWKSQQAKNDKDIWKCREKCSGVICNEEFKQLKGYKQHFDTAHRKSDDKYYFEFMCPRNQDCISMIGSRRHKATNVPYSSTSRTDLLNCKGHGSRDNCNYNVIYLSSWEEYWAKILNH